MPNFDAMEAIIALSFLVKDIFFHRGNPNMVIYTFPVHDELNKATNPVNEIIESIQ